MRSNHLKGFLNERERKGGGGGEEGGRGREEGRRGERCLWRHMGGVLGKELTKMINMFLLQTISS